MRLLATSALLLALSAPTRSQDLVPGESWMRYADPAGAGWSAEGLAEAEAYWETIDSAAFMVVERGVVVVAWGDVERRFMCHSVRKSFMSGLYGIHVDAGTIDTEATMAQLEIDDEPQLTDIEKTARIEDLLRARSGVYKLAAYEPPQNPKPARGSHAPGTFWCYNNWDFNTLCTIFEQVTGRRVFEEFDLHFAGPLGMQDYRVRDGYYHYELDKSIHPAYPFRLSARDSARYGLLYLNQGMWGADRVLSEEWVARSTRSYSDTGNGGYAYMWWTFEDPRLGDGGMYAAQGVGGQMIAVLPAAGLVVVNRTNTYLGKNVGTDARLRLVGMILAAQPEETPADLVLVPLESSSQEDERRLSPAQLASYAGEYHDEVLDEDLVLRGEGGELVFDTSFMGAFTLIPVAEDVFLVEDTDALLRITLAAGRERGDLIWELGLQRAFDAFDDAGEMEDAMRIAERAVELFPMSAMAHVLLATAFAKTGDPLLAGELVEAALELDPGNGEAIAVREALRELSGE